MNRLICCHGKPYEKILQCENCKNLWHESCLNFFLKPNLQNELQCCNGSSVTLFVENEYKITKSKLKPFLFLESKSDE